MPLFILEKGKALFHNTGASLIGMRIRYSYGVKSHRYDSYRREMLDQYRVNEYRATRGNRDDLVPYHVNIHHKGGSVWKVGAYKIK